MWLGGTRLGNNIYRPNVDFFCITESVILISRAVSDEEHEVFLLRMTFDHFLLNVMCIYWPVLATVAMHRELVGGILVGTKSIQANEIASNNSWIEDISGVSV